MATTLSNKVDVLSMDESVDEEVSFKIDNLVKGAMELIPSRDEGKDRQLVCDIVKAVVAALFPMVQSISAQLQNSSQISTTKVKSVIQKQNHRLDELDQYSRRDNIVFRGVSEKEGESTTKLVLDIAACAGVDISEADISTSHRLGKPPQVRTSTSKPRPIMAQFVRRDLRTNLLKSKRKLQGTDFRHVMLGEHLSPGRAKLLKAVKDDDGTAKTWTIDGRIYCTLNKDGTDGRKYVLSTPDDLFRKLGWGEEKLKNSGLFVDIEC